VAANALFGGGGKRVVKANKTLAIVGESGCGKSTFAKVLMGLETATGGKVFPGDEEIRDTPIEERSTETISSVQMVFQNPFDRLNPSMTVGRQLIRALGVFGIGANDAKRKQRMLTLLDLVKLPRAFAGDARIVVADEVDGNPARKQNHPVVHQP
jgi:peptide/nickel transport system ATP-binding protein